MPKPTRSPRYLAFVRTLPCCVCGWRRNIEAAHTGPHATSQKSSDLCAIPLCRLHHQTGTHSLHRLGPRNFEQTHGISIRAVVERLNAKPFISIEGTIFVGTVGEHEYELCSVQAGLPKAIKTMLRLRREFLREAA